MRLCKSQLLLALLAALLAAVPVPAAETLDVVVVGGTPGGISAALTAARLGRSVALIEYHPHLGGMTASGLGKSDVDTRQAIGGVFREFVGRVYDHYVETYGPRSENVERCRDGYYYEPSVAEKIFDQMIAEESKIKVYRNHRLEEAVRRGRKLAGVRIRDRATEQMLELRAAVFIDATYEGDLAAFAGAPYRLGREGREEFNELHAGVVYQDHNTRRFLAGTTGEGDDRLTAYTYRLCLTDDPANSVPLTAPPPDYDRRRYLDYLDDLRDGRLGRPKQMVEGVGYYSPHFNTMVRVFSFAKIPNNKYDVNMNPRPLGFPFAEENEGYPEGGWEKREEIARRIRNITLGLLYFIQNDEAVAKPHREMAREYHFPKDEFADNGHFPFQLYVREARRIIGEYTLTEHDVTAAPEAERAPVHFDSVAAGEFPIDSFPVRKREAGHDVALEGYILMLDELTRPYQAPYRIMVPQQVDGLLVPVAASTTHVAYSTIRMEPTWMALGQAAGSAAHLAIKHHAEPREVRAEPLQRLLLEQGQVITYYQDLDKADPAFEALQFFGTKGFFTGYRADSGKPLERGLAAHWLNLALRAARTELRVGTGVKFRWSDFGPDRPYFADVAALAAGGVIAWPRPGSRFEPLGPLTHRELESWLVAVGSLLGVWERPAAGKVASAVLRENGLGADRWVGGSQVQADRPVRRGEFCRVLYLLWEKAGF